MGDVKPIIVYVVSGRTPNYRGGRCCQNFQILEKIMNELDLIKVNSVIKNWDRYNPYRHGLDLGPHGFRSESHGSRPLPLSVISDLSSLLITVEKPSSINSQRYLGPHGLNLFLASRSFLILIFDLSHSSRSLSNLCLFLLNL